MAGVTVRGGGGSLAHVHEHFQSGGLACRSAYCSMAALPVGMHPLSGKWWWLSPHEGTYPLSTGEKAPCPLRRHPHLQSTATHGTHQLAAQSLHECPSCLAHSSSASPLWTTEGFSTVPDQPAQHRGPAHVSTVCRAAAASPGKGRVVLPTQLPVDRVEPENTAPTHP